MKDDHVFYSAVHPHEGQRKFMLRGLDGVRAIAVLLVLVYHFWPQVLPGGMVGVDIFFVISGYLITALLLREGAYTGKMDIVSFWVRRLRRLIPAVAVLTVVIGAFALLVGSDVQVGLGRQILGAFTYSSNWLLIAAGNDYFTQTSPELMTNFWSLAVEEQFYFFWPVLLVFTFMFTAKWWQRSLVPAVLGFVSLVLAAVMALVGVSSARIYYGTDTHLYGLMLGVLLAMLIPWSMYPPVDARLYEHVGFGNGRLGLVRQGLGWFSVLMVVPLALTLSDLNPALLMPWGLLAGSLLGLGMVQALLPDVRGGSSDAFRAVLSLPPLVWVGQRSYGIYLWHWPLMVFAHYIFGANRGPWVNVLLFLLTFVAAGLSYMFVEQPVRRLGFRGALDAWLGALFAPAKRGLPIAVTAVFFLGLVGTVFAVRTAPEMTQAESAVAAGANFASSAPSPAAEGASAQDGSSPAQATATDGSSAAGSTNDSGITIIGDSVTLASAEALATALPNASVDAAVSRTSSQAVPLAIDLAKKGELGDVLVLSVTANSTFTIEQLETLRTEALDGGKRKLVLVTGVGPANLTWIEPSNKVLKDFARQHPQDVVVADWQAAAKGHPEYFVSDGVHPQGQGLTVYAQTLQQAVEKAQSL